MTCEFRSPQVILTGSNAHKTFKYLPEMQGGKSALFITDSARVDEAVENSVRADLIELGYSLFSFDVKGARISDEAIRKAVELTKEHTIETVVAIGGRAAVQSGKLVAMLSTNGGDIDNFRQGERITKQPLPLVAIAMTSSSGSAISNCACYSDGDTGIRCCIADSKLIPTIAVLDPALTSWQSPQDMASDGVTSLGFAIEALASDMATPVTDACALEAITAIVKWLPEAYAQSLNVEAREQLMFAQQLVSMARSNTTASMVCRLAGQVEAKTHIPGGNVVAALLPHVLDHYNEYIPERVKMIGDAIVRGDKTLSAMREEISASDAMRDIIKRLDMPLQLSFLGFEPGQVEELLSSLHCGAFLDHTPLPSDPDVLRVLLNKAL